MTEEKDETKEGSSKRRSPKASAPVPVAPKIEGLLIFLVDLFEDGFPNKVALHAVFGPTGKRRGPLIKDFSFKASEKPNHEDLIELSNLMVQLAQEECEVFGKSTNFGVFAYDLLRNSEHYQRKLFNLKPQGTSQALAEERGETVYEDEDNGGSMSTKLLLSILEGERRDKRWMMEMLANVVTGSQQRDAERIAALEEQADGIYDRSTKYISATEQMLNQAEDRRARSERAAMWNEMMREGVDMLRKTLVPAVAVYLSKGKVGVVQGLRDFIDGLTADVKRELLGADGERGVLDEDQARLILGIADGDEEPRRLTEFLSSLRPEQAQEIMERGLLTPAQIGTLQALAKAITDVSNQEEAKAQP